MRRPFGLVLLHFTSFIVSSFAFDVPLRRIDGIANCEFGASTHTFTGFSVDTFRLAAKLSGFTETDTAPSDPLSLSSSSFKFVCTNYTGGQAITMLASGAATYKDAPVFVGLFTINQERMALGIQFTFAYLRTGLAVMVPRVQSEPGYWAMFRPFTMTLWAALIITALCQPLITWIVERLALKGTLQLDKMLTVVTGNAHLHHDGWLSPLGTPRSTVTDNAIKTTYLYEELKYSMYQGIMSAFQTLTQDVRSLPGMILNIAFSFLTLVIISTYTATLTQFVQTNAKLSVTNVSQLTGKNVAAHSLYRSDLRSFYQVQSVPLDFVNEQTFLKVERLLANRTYSAYIYDQPTLTRMLRIYDAECKFGLLTQPIMPFDIGFPFHPSTPPEIVKNFSAALMTAQRSGWIQNLHDQYVDGTTPRCALLNLDEQRMDFKSMAGLWIILAVAIGVALIISIGAALYMGLYKAIRHDDQKHGFKRSKPPTLLEIMKKAGDKDVWKSIINAGSSKDLRELLSEPPGPQGQGQVHSFSAARERRGTGTRSRTVTFIDRPGQGLARLSAPRGMSQRPSGIVSPAGGPRDRDRSHTEFSDLNMSSFMASTYPHHSYNPNNEKKDSAAHQHRHGSNGRAPPIEVPVHASDGGSAPIVAAANSAARGSSAHIHIHMDHMETLAEVDERMVSTDGRVGSGSRISILSGDPTTAAAPTPAALPIAHPAGARAPHGFMNGALSSNSQYASPPARAPLPVPPPEERVEPGESGPRSSQEFYGGKLRIKVPRR